MLTPNDVAELTGYSEETIRRWCRSWKLKTITGRPPYNIKGKDLKDFLFSWTRNDLIKNLIKKTN
nr:helix-turn-helix domain-containing protein [Mesobacillus maritimus]